MTKDEAGYPAESGFALAEPEKTGASLAELMHTGMGIPSPFMKDIFLVRQAIVGTRYQGGSDDLVEDLTPGSRVSFIAEPDNRFDENAVAALDGQGRKLGYIPRHENRIIGALLKAGKYIYGIMPEKQPEGNLAAGKTPYSLWVDLYMREFVTPDDPSAMPRQGYRGSYAVVDVTLSEDKRQIGSIYAIKVINGEERDTLRVKPDPEDPAKYREDIFHFAAFAGYLPMVSHGITDEILPVLEETYGVQLGRAFSSQVIDTAQMAVSHIPWQPDYTLEALAQKVHIEAGGETAEERRCRMTWKLYCSMEQSDVRWKSRDLTGNGEDSLKLNVSIEACPMSAAAREFLRKKHVATLKELSRCSEKEIFTSKRTDPALREELASLLEAANASFRPEQEDRFLYGYPEYLQIIAEETEGIRKYYLLFGCFRTYYEWLKPARDQKIQLWNSALAAWKFSDIEDVGAWIKKELNNADHFSDMIIHIFNTKIDNALKHFDVPGADRAIVEGVEDMMTVYKEVLQWRQMFTSFSASLKYRKCFEVLLKEGSDCIFDCFDQFYHESKRVLSRLDAYTSGRIDGEQLSTTVTVNMTLHKDAVTAAWEEARKK